MSDRPLATSGILFFLNSYFFFENISSTGAREPKTLFVILLAKLWAEVREGIFHMEHKKALGPAKFHVELYKEKIHLI